MSVIVGGDKIIVHSYIPPIVFTSPLEADKRFVIADGKWTEIPLHLGQNTSYISRRTLYVPKTKRSKTHLNRK